MKADRISRLAMPAAWRCIGAACALLMLSMLGSSAPAKVPTHRFDLLVRSGTIVDGSGRPAYSADVGIRAGRIVFIGQAGAKAAARTLIDAKGLIVAPGLIDVHNHVPDHLEAVVQPVRNEAYIRQGVTTIVGGADGGMSPSEISEAAKRLALLGTTTNFAFYVGHNGVRREVMGMAQREPTPAELTRMKALVRLGMEMGAVGLSSGLMYPPGMYSRTAELVQLAKEIRPFNGIYDTHTRDPVFRFLESDKEALQIGRDAGVPVKIAHEKAAGIINKGKMRDAIALIEAARAAGQRVFTDQYPYDGALVSKLESWFIVPGTTGDGPPSRDEVLDAIARARTDQDFASTFRAASEQGENGGFSWIKAVGYGSMRIVASTDFPDLVGKNVELLAKERKVTPFALMSDLFAASSDKILIAGSIEESEVRELLVRPWNMIGSDGGWVSVEKTTSLHPRSTGTFARVLGLYTRDLALLEMPEAIRKMTSLPAEVLGLEGRGLLKVGAAADIMIFDQQRISDRSTWSEPHHFATGVAHVIVNGQLVLKNGVLVDALPGSWLKRADGGKR